LRTRQAFYSTSVLLLFSAFGSKFVRADVFYQVSVDTSGFSRQSGNLDFEFNPSDNRAEMTTAAVTDFRTAAGILASSATLTGDIAGPLPSALTQENGTTFNDNFQGVTDGSRFSFYPTRRDQPVTTQAARSAQLSPTSLYDDNAGATALLTVDSNGNALIIINVNANGTTSVESLARRGDICHRITALNHPLSFNMSRGRNRGKFRLIAKIQ
jgi:hypothetical protein